MIYDSMEFIKNRKEIWIKRLEEVEEYFKKYNKKPSYSDKDVDIKRLCSWISHQQNNYLNNEQIMKDENMRKYWNNFTEKYKKYFISNNEVWFNTLKLVEEYIIKNSKIPSSTDKDIEIKKLGTWISHQKQNYSKNEYIMRDETIKNLWINFTTKYKQYFLSNNEIWFNNLKQVEDYIGGVEYINFLKYLFLI